MRLLMIGLAVVGLLLAAFFLTYWVWKSKVETVDFRQFAEQKAGDFLKSKVSIADIKIGLLNQVALNGLEISSTRHELKPFEVHIDKIIFHYDLIKVLTQRFDAPSAVVFESPEITIPGEIFPYEMFRQLNFGKGQGVISSVRFRDGYVRYRIPAMDSDLELYDVDGSFRLAGLGQFEIDFQAQLRGFLIGTIHLKGTVDALQHTHHLKLHLKDVSFGQKFYIPLQSMDGNVRWENDNLYFDELNAVVHGWKSRVSGLL